MQMLTPTTEFLEVFQEVHFQWPRMLFTCVQKAKTYRTYCTELRLCKTCIHRWAMQAQMKHSCYRPVTWLHSVTFSCRFQTDIHLSLLSEYWLHFTHLCTVYNVFTVQLCECTVGSHFQCVCVAQQAEASVLDNPVRDRLQVGSYK